MLLRSTFMAIGSFLASGSGLTFGLSLTLAVVTALVLCRVAGCGSFLQPLRL